MRSNRPCFSTKLPSRRILRRSSGCLLLACTAALCCASCGPRMRVQPSIKPYEMKMPEQPAGTVSTRGRMVTFTEQQSRLARNPLPATPLNLHNGRIYYGYYCLTCHGERGDGDGPVGQSYVPKPTDLASGHVAKMNDGELYIAMLTGNGHDPVLIQTVLPDHRWPLVMYVRTLAKR